MWCDATHKSKVTELPRLLAGAGLCSGRSDYCENCYCVGRVVVLLRDGARICCAKEISGNLQVVYVLCCVCVCESSVEALLDDE